MHMSEQEIVASYNGAKTKRKQISILKDLNYCTREEIIEILVKNGISEDELPDKRKKPVAKPKEQPIEEKETMVPAKEQTKQPDSLQGLLDCLVGYSVAVQGQILKKEKVLEKFSVAIGAIKEAQEIMDSEVDV